MKQHRSTLLKAERRDFVDDYKAAEGCIDCGEKDPARLDLDHRPGVDKFMSVAEMVSTGQSLEKLKAELEKCEVRCANCHRKITRKESEQLDAWVAQCKSIHF